MSSYEKWTDVTPVTNEMMYERWKRLVWKVVNEVHRKFFLTLDERDDLINDVWVKLLNISQDMRPFSGYTVRVITNAVRDADYIRNYRGMAKPAAGSESGRNKVRIDLHQFSQLIPEDETFNVEEDLLPAHKLDLEDEVVTRLTLEKLLPVLDDVEMLVITLLYGLNNVPRHTIEGVQIVLAVSRMEVRYAVKKAMSKLQVAARGTSDYPEVEDIKERKRHNLSPDAGEDILNERHGHLTAVQRVGSSRTNGVLWVVVCDCGTRLVMSTSDFHINKHCHSTCRTRYPKKAAAPVCKSCGKKPGKFYGPYVTGEFCSRKCAMCFSTKHKRQEINRKVSQTLLAKKR